MRVTINDVAKAAKVSKSTVSKVMNDHPSIPEKTKKRIRKVIKDLNFIPSSAAKNLAKQQSQSLLILFELQKRNDPFDPFFYDIVAGIEHHTFPKGYDVTLCNAIYTEREEDILERFVYSNRADGIFLNATYLRPSLIEKLQEREFPFVIVGDPGEHRSIHWADVNNMRGSEIAARHLLEQGYQRIGFIGAKPEISFSNKRMRGYKFFMEEQGENDADRYLKFGFTTTEEAHQLMAALLALDPKPDAVICEDNYSAFAALQAIQARGLSVPDDIGIVAFNNYPLAPYLNPPLTVIDIDTFELGITAAKMLLERITHPDDKGKMTMIEPTLIERESTQRESST